MTYPLLHTLSVSAMLLEVAGLAEEVDVEPSAVRIPPRRLSGARWDIMLLLQVQSLLFDPADSRRLAFHLGAACASLLPAHTADSPCSLACGWSGVIDLSALAVTHVHCPPPPWLANGEVRVGLTGVVCWKT